MIGGENFVKRIINKTYNYDLHSSKERLLG